jgi:hypothetical protein
LVHLAWLCPICTLNHILPNVVQWICTMGLDDGCVSGVVVVEKLIIHGAVNIMARRNGLDCGIFYGARSNFQQLRDEMPPGWIQPPS